MAAEDIVSCIPNKHLNLYYVLCQGSFDLYGAVALGQASPCLHDVAASFPVLPAARASVALLPQDLPSPETTQVTQLYFAPRKQNNKFVAGLCGSSCFPFCFAAQFSLLSLFAWGLQRYFTVNRLTMGLVLCRTGTCWSAADEPGEPRGLTWCC